MTAAVQQPETLERPVTRSLTERAPHPLAPPSRAHPGAVLAGIYVGAAMVLSLWWANADTQSTLGDWLTEVGRITGLLAGYAVVVLLALMARVPALERGIGSDRLARWHGLGGRYTVTLIVAHGLFITWGYAVTSQTGVVEQGKTLVLTYPNVMMATVAGALFVMIGAVSARAARRRMRYETCTSCTSTHTWRSPSRSVTSSPPARSSSTTRRRGSHGRPCTSSSPYC
ncbi:MAG: ferric reductase-like transmembrane domain-containing protein [Geodermatophilaceae bacterium]